MSWLLLRFLDFVGGLGDPHVDPVESSAPPGDLTVELVDGMTPDMRSRLAAKLREPPGVVSVRVDD